MQSDEEYNEEYKRKKRIESQRTRALANPDLRQAVLEKVDGRCWYCGADLTKDGALRIDHVQAASKGGSNDLDNLVPSCQSCNSSKKAKSISEFRMHQMFAPYHVKPATGLKQVAAGVKFPIDRPFLFFAETRFALRWKFSTKLDMNTGMLP